MICAEFNTGMVFTSCGVGINEPVNKLTAPFLSR